MVSLNTRARHERRKVMEPYGETAYSGRGRSLRVVFRRS